LLADEVGAVSACRSGTSPRELGASAKRGSANADYAGIRRARTEWYPGKTQTCATQGAAINLNLTIGPLVALIAGILILIIPRLLNYIVALYLIVIGLLGLFGGNFNLK